MKRGLRFVSKPTRVKIFRILRKGSPPGGRFYIWTGVRKSRRFLFVSPEDTAPPCMGRDPCAAAVKTVFPQSVLCRKEEARRHIQIILAAVLREVFLHKRFEARCIFATTGERLQFVQIGDLCFNIL